MLVKYWKNFKWFLFIPLIMFFFFFNINNASAFVVKENMVLTVDGLERTGVLTPNASNSFVYDFQDNISTQGYDILAVTFYRFLMFGTGSINLDNTDTTDNFSFTCTYGAGGYCSNATISQTSGGDIDYSGNYSIVDTTIQGKIIDTNGKENLCFMSDDYKNMMFCPVVNMQNVDKLQVFMYHNGANMRYQVSIYPLGYKYNYDVSELSTQQTQINTNLQYIYQYQQDDSTSGATTQVSGDFTQLAQDFNSQLSGVNDLTQLVLLPISLFMDLSTDNCQPLHLQIPYVNMSVDLPCMKAVFNQYFNGLYSIFTTIMSAVICYWVAIKTGALVKEIVDCDNDRIEVVDL